MDRRQSHNPSLPNMDFLQRQEKNLDKIRKKGSRNQDLDIKTMNVRHNSVVMPRTKVDVNAGDRNLTERQKSLIGESTRVAQEDDQPFELS